MSTPPSPPSGSGSKTPGRASSNPSSPEDRTEHFGVPREESGKPGELKLVSNPHVEAASEIGNPAREANPGDVPVGGFEDPADAQSASASAASATEGQDPGDTSRRGLPLWVFLLLVLISVVALGWQLRIAGQLESEIAGLEEELSATKSRLGAHESRLIEIRGGVHDLVVRLEDLKTLVDADPGSAVDRADPLAASPPDPEIPARLPQY